MLAVGLLAMLGLFASVFFIFRGIKKKRPVKKAIIAAIVCALVVIGAGGNLDTAEEGSAPAGSDAGREVITIVAGEKGAYGEEITMNEGTEFEETYFVYRVPAGTYTAANIGEHMDQLSIYGDAVCTTEEGWEELSDVGGVLLLEAGEAGEVSIAEGQIIEIHEPGKWTLEKIG